MPWLPVPKRLRLPVAYNFHRVWLVLHRLQKYHHWIFFPVQWWNTLHQGASVSVNQAPSMATTMLMGMLIMVLASWMYSIAVILKRTRVIILEREGHTSWVAELQKKEYIQ